MKGTPLLTAAVIVIIAANPVRGAGQSLEGTWEGFLRPSPGIELRIVLKVDPPEREGGPPRAAFYSPDQEKGEESDPADPIALDGEAVTFTVKAIKGSFSGTMNEAGDEIKGDWKQGSASVPLTFKRDEAALVFPEIWEGKVKIGPAELRLIFHITRLKGGALRATFDSPDQGVDCTKIDEVNIDKGTLTLVTRSIAAAFEGKLNDEGTESVGEWKQAGATIPLTIKKVVAPTRAKRPQLTRRPFPLDGTWEGFLRPKPSTELRIVLKVDPAEQEGGPPRAAFYSPDQGKAEESFPADPIALDGKAVSFTVKALHGSYSGTMNEAGDEIKGDWKQGPANLPMTFKRDEAALVFPEIWEGKLKAGPTELRLIFHITRLKGGAFRATFDSPDQQSDCTKIDEVSMDKGTLTLVARSIRATFAGKLNDEGAESVGEWKQGGQAIPFTIKKVAVPTRPKRPQRPTPPFPYDETLVTYENEAAGVTLAGTLTTPQGKGPFPAVVLITGSGALDRDETMYGHKPFLVLADHLTRRGIAVLRVDDRGVGGSTGDTDTTTTDDFAGDVLAGVAFLKTRQEVDPAQIGLLGHSEGGIIAPMVAVRSQDVAFLVLLAGTGVDGEELCLRQNYLMSQAAGASEELLKFLGELLPKLIAGVKAEKDPKIASERLRAIVRELLAKLPEAERTALGEDDSWLNDLVARLNHPWLRYFLAYDPRPMLRKVKCPVLALNGEKDLQVPPKENLAAIASALKDGGNTHATVKELPGLNHLFQSCTTGALSEYAQIEETIAPMALELIGDWIREQAGLK